VDFGDVNNGDIVEKKIRVSNYGGGTLTGSLVISGDDFSIAEMPSFNLLAGQIKYFTILFAANKKGQAEGTLSISSNGGADVDLLLSAKVQANSIFSCGATSGNMQAQAGDVFVVVFCALILALATRRSTAWASRP